MRFKTFELIVGGATLTLQDGKRQINDVFQKKGI